MGFMVILFNWIVISWLFKNFYFLERLQMEASMENNRRFRNTFAKGILQKFLVRP